MPTIPADGRSKDSLGYRVRLYIQILKKEEKVLVNNS
jgi:hypothetical protein